MKTNKSLCLLVLLGIHIGYISAAATEEVSATTSPLRANWGSAEEFVTNELSVGKVADLGLFTNTGGAAEICGEFLAGLMTNPVISHRGIRIRNAVVTNTVNLANMEIGSRVTLENCRFLSWVNLSCAHFTKDLALTGSTFHTNASFSGAHVDGQFNLSNAVFLAVANFNRLEVGGDFDSKLVWFGGQTVFKGAKVGHYAALDAIPFFETRAEKAGPIQSAEWIVKRFEPQGCSLSSSLELRRIDGPIPHWRLLDTEQHLAFSIWPNSNGYSVNRTTYVGGDFEAPGCSIARELTMSDAYFQGTVSLDSLRVDDSMSLKNADFDGPVSLGFANIGHQLAAAFTTFRADLNLYNLQCGECVMNNAYFKNGVIFVDATIGTELELQDCSFGPSYVADFFATHVNGSAYFNAAKFNGPANFILMQVGGNFDASETRFNDVSSIPQLLKMTAHRPSTFNSDFGSLRVDGFAFFDKAQFAGTLSFRNAAFQNIFLDNVTMKNLPVSPTARDSLRLEGMTFKRIRSVPDANASLDRETLLESWKNLSALLADHSPYTFEIYDNLETYFRQEGQTGIADEVFVEGKRQERKQALKPYSIPWFVSCFLDYTVGFGRRPLRAAVWSLGFITLGAMLFGRYMHRKNEAPAKNRLRYAVDSFWYSLDMFVPLLDLGTSDDWKPRQANGKILWYGYIHSILGYVFVPVWIAALTGLIK